MSTPDEKGKFPMEIKNVFSKERNISLNVNGWGFKDSYFTSRNGTLIFTGNRYPLCNAPIKNARQYMLDLFDVDIKEYQPPEISEHQESDYPPAVENHNFCEDLTNANIDFTLNFKDRFHRSHGQAIKDLYVMKYGKYDRIPDIVVFPKCHEDVILCVQLANKYLSVIIPYGGGTNKMLSLSHSKNDRRFFISLDTTQMNRILWIDKESMLACIEAGIAGRDMEDALEKEGLTVGHEPDSIELSTLGGWVSTRASGIKRQTYGNIEEIVNKITLVTSVGVMEKDFIAPRVSIGPDFDHLVLGSEGTLGVITKVTVKVHNRPKVKIYGSICFPDFEHGVKFMKEVSKFPIKPSSLRLFDSSCIKAGHAFDFKRNFFAEIVNKVKLFCFQYYYHYDINQIALVAYIIENDKCEAKSIEKKIKQVAITKNGYISGTELGKKVYMMNLLLCYTRDLFFNFGALGDSLETSVSWGKLMPLLRILKKAWENEMKVRKYKNSLGIQISEIYHSGACVYICFVIGQTGNKDQLEAFNELSNTLRGLMIKHGGTLSHHYGVGKKNMEFYPQSVSKVGVDILKAIKAQIDPNNVFGVGNLINHKL